MVDRFKGPILMKQGTDCRLGPSLIRLCIYCSLVELGIYNVYISKNSPYSINISDIVTRVIPI